MNHWKRIAGAVSAATLVTVSTGARAEDMDWIGIAYLWGAGITIDTQNQTADIDFEDLIDNLEMSFMGHVEAQGDTLGGFVDVAFVGVGDNESRANADLNTDNDTINMDIALTWNPGAERMSGLSVYGGLRYVSNDFHIVVDPVPPLLPSFESGIDKSYYDLLFGARYVVPFSSNWRATFQGDFSLGDTEGTFGLGAYAAYVSGQHHFLVGYKHLQMDLESGSGNELTVTLTGPAIAYGYAF